MSRIAITWISIGIAATTGIICGEFAASSVVLHDKLGTICGRGHLLALVRDRGIYQADLDRTLAEFHYLAGTDHNQERNLQRQSALTDLIANAAARAHARSEKILRTEMEHELSLLQSQFRDDKTWRLALNASDLSESSLWRMLRNDLGSRQWISKRILPELDVTEGECRRFYGSHLKNFFVPDLP